MTNNFQIAVFAAVAWVAGCAPGGLGRVEIAELNMRGRLEGVWAPLREGRADPRGPVLRFRADGTVAREDGTRCAYRLRGDRVIIPGGEAARELLLRRRPLRLDGGGEVYVKIEDGPASREPD